MTYRYFEELGLSPGVFAAGLALFGLVAACEGEHREYPKNPPQPNTNDSGKVVPASSPDLVVGAPSPSSETPLSESSAVTQLLPSHSAEQEETADDSNPPACVEGSSESCGPPREEGLCKFGKRTCANGAWGECVGGIFPAKRDCSSTADNDCDGQPDDTLDDVCRCPVDGSRACDEHEGLDGQGRCHAGQQTCVVAEGGVSSDWGACSGSVGPSAMDSCNVAGDDANCDGTPNGGCTCVEGATAPCGPDTDTGICQRGTSTCRNGAFGACQGAVIAGRRDCSSAQDNDCDGLPDNRIDTSCTCVIGDMQACGAHPDRDGNGACRAGTQVCQAGAQNVTSRFGACNGSVGPAQRDLCTVREDDSDCNGVLNGGCQCIAGGGNAPCSGDANNSRCSPQGTCAPCQANVDCLLVSGGRSICSAGRCVAARCGDGVVTAGEVCDDGNAVDADACTNACQAGLNLPVVTVERFSWTSRQGPVDMRTTQGRACFFTRFGGAFNTAADSVQIVSQGGRWVLTGSATAGGFVEARAACVSASGVTNEVSVQATPDARASVALEDDTTHVCFFTRMAGNFRTGSENIQIGTADGTWRLGSSALQAAGVAASARCMLMQGFSAPRLLAFGVSGPSALDPQLTGACYLTRASGEFEAEGDVVETEWTGSNWVIRSSAGSTLQTSAVCFGRNDGSGVPPL